MRTASAAAVGSPAAEAVAHLAELIRIPSVNPPGLPDGAAGRDSAGAELVAARYCAEVLTAAGIEARVVESVPGRGSCVARLRASPSVREPEPPLVLLGHLDVVPVDEEAWSRDPFGGEEVDGVVWGRGAVDMKDMVAMELAVMTDLRRRGVELRRDVVFAAVADEEAGGEYGAGFLVRHQPTELSAADGRPAAAALNEVGGYSLTLGARRFYTIQVAEKGIAWTRLRATGTPGHASMPDADNAAVKLGRAVARLGAAPRPARLHPVVAEFLSTLGLDGVAAAAAGEDPGSLAAALRDAVADPILRRSLDAMLRDTVTPTVLGAGKKVNVLPATAEAEIDVRTLPGTDQIALMDDLRALVGNDAEVASVLRLPAVEWPADAPIVRLMREALHRADPEATPVPTMITPGTDAKHLMQLGIPTYGFAPLRLDPETPFLSLFHGHDERLPISALEFGVPVLTEVVERFCAVEPSDGGA